MRDFSHPLLGWHTLVVGLNFLEAAKRIVASFSDREDERRLQMPTQYALHHAAEMALKSVCIGHGVHKFGRDRHYLPGLLAVAKGFGFNPLERFDALAQAHSHRKLDQFFRYIPTEDFSFLQASVAVGVVDEQIVELVKTFGQQINAKP